MELLPGHCCMTIVRFEQFLISMLKFIKDAHSLEGKVLIVCGISAGFVPIYALDHLIPLNGFKRVAFFHSQHLEHSVGYLPTNIEGGALGLPGELYVSGGVAILQFRSLVRFARKKHIAKQISALAAQHKVSSVVVLASLPYDIKPDLEIQSLKKNVYFKLKGNVEEGIRVRECQQGQIIKELSLLCDQDEADDDILKSAGLSAALLKEFQNILVLMAFNEKEDDKQTGVSLAGELHKIIDRKQLSIVQ